MPNIVQLKIRDKTYSIYIGYNILEQMPVYCEQLEVGKKCLVVGDSHTAPLYAEPIVKALNISGYSAALATVPAGEEAKSPEHLLYLYKEALHHKIDRSSFFVAVGGGVVGDLTGFAAATYMRGIPYLQVPTTIMAMVDSAIGGKTGINLPHGKNLVGAFHQPSAVISDLQVLTSLPHREYLSGLAEIVKYGIIRDRALFEKLEKNAESLRDGKDYELLEEIITACCRIKAEIVEQDEREENIRAILNFGHTFGHALEKVTGYKSYLHGEAVAIGIAYATEMSMQLVGLPATEGARITGLLKKLGLPIEWQGADRQKIVTAMGVDKKNKSGRVRWVLAEKIGQVRYGCEVPDI